jgi:hypothetical protein
VQNEGRDHLDRRARLRADRLPHRRADGLHARPGHLRSRRQQALSNITARTDEALDCAEIRLRQLVLKTENEIEPRSESHGLQLKGAGERIRKLEAELAGAQQTIDEILKTVNGIVKRRIDATKDDVARLAVKTLSSKVMGGSLGDSGLTQIGEITQLRQQVEGINSTLGTRIARMEKNDQAAFRLIAQSAARTAVSDELIRRAQERRAERWWRRLSFWS